MLLRRADLVRFGRNNDRRVGLRAEVKLQYARVEKIFDKIQTALPLGVIFEIPVPMSGAFDILCVMSKVKGWKALVRGKTREPGTRAREPGTRVREPGTRLREPLHRIREPLHRARCPRSGSGDGRGG